MPRLRELKPRKKHKLGTCEVWHALEEKIQNFLIIIDELGVIPLEWSFGEWTTTTLNPRKDFNGDFKFIGYL